MYFTIPKEKNGDIVKKYWTKSKWKPKGQTPNPIVLCPMSKDLGGFYLLVLLTTTHLSILTSPTPFVPLSLPGDTPQLWHLRHLLVSNTIQASLPQFHTMTSLDHHAETPLSHAWPSQISFTSEKDPKALYSCVLQESKARTSKLWRLPRSAACLTGSLVPSLNYICIWLVCYCFSEQIIP